MINHFNELDSHFNLNHTYKKKIGRLNRVICVLCTLVYSYNFLTILPYFLRLDRITSVTRNINEIYIVYINQKFILELMALVALVSVLIEFLRCINAIATKAYEKLEKVDIKATKAVSVIPTVVWKKPRQHDQFYKLDVIYYHIYGVMSLFKKIYEFQIFVCLASLILFSVLFTFSVILLVIATNSYNIISTAILYLMSFFVVVVLLSTQGQKLVNIKHSFSVTMTRLNFRLASANESNKYVKELMHVSSLQTVDLSCFGTLSLDMSLVPTMVSISTTYIIVVLQLTHLV